MACRLWFAGDRSVDVVNASIFIEPLLSDFAEPA